jgi:hypothetical protein
VQDLEEPQDLEGGRAVEVAGRLVGEDDERLVGERPGDRDALALAAGQRRGQVIGARAEPDLAEQLDGPPSRPPGRASGQEGRQLDVLPRGQLVHQVERLEDEADVTASHPGQAALAHLVGAPPVQPQLPARGPVQPAEQMEQR